MAFDNLKLLGFEGKVHLVNRSGGEAMSQRQELIRRLATASAEGRGLILFARKKPANYGDPWDGKGLSYELLEDVGCR